MVEIPKPTVAQTPGMCLVRVLRCGVCNTDLEILQGYMGFKGVLGHEFVGIVEEVNCPVESVRANWIGKRVCGDINLGCAHCLLCQSVTPEAKPDDKIFWDKRGCSKMARNHCPNRTVLGILNKDGCIAQYITLPLTNLHIVPVNVPDEVAVFAEPLAAAIRIVEQGLVRYGTDSIVDRVAILGDGKLGLMIAEVIGREYLKWKYSDSNTTTVSKRHCLDYKSDGNDPIQPVMFGKHQHKLDLVRDSGVETRFVSECIDETTFSGVHEKHSGKYDVVVDATGSPSGLKLAAGLCRPMGTLVLKSTCAEGRPFNAAPFVIDELRVVGSRCGPIDKALDLLAKRDESTPIPVLKVEKYITKTFHLSDACLAFESAAERSTMKVQIICSDSDVDR